MFKKEARNHLNSEFLFPFAPKMTSDATVSLLIMYTQIL